MGKLLRHAMEKLFEVSITCGAHRLVLSTKLHALKVPRLSALPDGRWANRTERETWMATPAPHLCPVICSNKWGWFVLMPFARPLSDQEFLAHTLQDAQTPSNPFLPDPAHGDFKRSNFGMLDGRIVKIDYGGAR
jgi:hypothetical protein